MQSLVKVDEVTPEKLAKYDLIGFGSGIYGYKHHKELIEFIEKMSSINKNVFIFSTSGNYRERH
ncbi:MAG: flavodoxin domain-containing protein, partial [Methanobacterium sp.]